MVLVGSSIITGLATYVILTGLTPITPTQDLIIWLLSANAALVGAMALLIGWQVLRLYLARRRGIAGAGLHIRMITLFGVIAAVPAIIVAIFASVTLNRGLDAWFSERTRSIVDTSVTVAQAYMREHSEVTRQALAQIANDLSTQADSFKNDRESFIKRLASHAALRGLVAAYIIDREKKILDASIQASDKLTFITPTDAMFEAAAKGDLVIVPPNQSNIIRALIKLDNMEDRYLYIYRPVDSRVLSQLIKAQESKQEFYNLMNSRQGVQLTFAFMYTGVSFIFLLSAVWIAMWFADRLVQPIVQLVDASRRVSKGELELTLREDHSAGDLATLSRTFNQMTKTLRNQREELLTTNMQLDARRRFTEAMLAGVSAGVMGLDAQGRITIVNPSAVSLLKLPEADIHGQMLEDILPAFAPIMAQADQRQNGQAQASASLKIGSEERTFLVRITTERSVEAEHGYVMTFDDITDLQSAQRNSAWSDIARRIAHEIKNPLTPIQLSAERLKRKYGKEITSDPKIFEQCTETIIRQVGDIGRMVDEFSSFARMPSAVLEADDLARVVKESVLLQRVSSSDILIDVETTDALPKIHFDRRLISQAVINLVKNAREAIEARQKESLEPKGHIEVRLEATDRDAIIRVIDNGIGLPQENRSRLTEPYMTTREKGTGLGLAIVQRIVEEHAGRLTLEDAPDVANGGRGACISLHIPFKSAPEMAAAHI